MIISLFCFFCNLDYWELLRTIMHRMRLYILLFLLTSFAILSLFAQSGVIVVPDSKGMYESFFALRDSTMRHEIGSFTFTGSLIGLSDKTEIREFEVMSQTDHSITLFLDDIKVHITAGSFFRTGRHFSYYGPYGYVYKIDGRSFWGYDGSVPERQIYSIEIFYGQDRVQIPFAAYRDIYEPNFCFRYRLIGKVKCHTRAFLSEDEKRIYVYMLNSRIPSLYEVCWIVTEGSYTGRVVDYAF